MIKRILRGLGRRMLSPRAAALIEHDLRRLRTRLKTRSKYGHQKVLRPEKNKLHLGCGLRKIQGWLNVDLTGSELDLDLADGWLPWREDVFDCVVSQHVIEHLQLERELLPLLNELRRTLKPGGEIWLSTPDIEKVCRSYQDNKMRDLIEGRKTRFPQWELGEVPSSHMINVLFHQGIEHRNLFDFSLLEWTLRESGFENVSHVSEKELLKRFPAFLPRRDEACSIYVRAEAA